MSVGVGVGFTGGMRDRIAAVQSQHHHWDYAGALTCACGEDFGLSDAGWEAAVAEWARHVADAVIRELQLTILGDGIVVGVIHV